MNRVEETMRTWICVGMVVATGLAAWAVITSYSIHYTKLYDFWLHSVLELAFSPPSSWCFCLCSVTRRSSST